MSELSVDVEELSPVVRRLKIDVPADRVNRVTDNVYRKLGQTVKLKGFRQGHVPRRVLEKYFADQVRTDVAREVVQSTFTEALGTTKLKPVAEPTVEPEELRPGETFRYTARVEVRPTIKLAAYRGLEATVYERKVTEADIDQRLSELRQAGSTLVPIEGREEAQLGDYGNVTYEVDIPGTGRKPQKREGGLVHIEPGPFLAGQGEALVGQKVGETRSFTEKFPDERTDNLKGKEAHITVTLTGLKTKELPDLDDDFAKEARGLDTLDALKQDIRTDLEGRSAAELKVATRSALVQQLVERNPADVPPALVDTAAERMTMQLIENLRRQGVDLPGGPGLVEQLKKDAIPRATADVKTYFLLEAIADAEGVEVQPEEIETRLQEIADEDGEPLAKVKTHYRTHESMAGLVGMMKNDKAYAIVEATARITVEPEPVKPEPLKPEPATESGAAP